MQIVTGSGVDDQQPLASCSTLCRLENRISRKTCFELNQLLVEWFIESFDSPPKEVTLGFVVLLALSINHTLACTTGAAIPIAMQKLGFDPAQSATIFATTVTDVGGFLALLGLASWLLL